MLKENEEWKSKSTSKNDNMEKKQKDGKDTNKKKSPQKMHMKKSNQVHTSA